MKRPAAACTTAWPPATEPVKATKSTPSEAIMAAAWSWEQCRYWNTPSGSPAALKASSKRSAHSGVWLECFRITALPARMAGTTAFTEVR